MNKLSGLLLAAILAMTGSVSVASAAQSPITLRFAADEPTGSVEDQGNLAFIKEVEERSNGRIKVEYFPGAQLGSDKQCLPSLLAGALDISFIAAGNLAELTPAMNCTDLPGRVNSP